MSAMTAEAETIQYEGWLQTARELHDTQDGANWRLSNVVHDLVKFQRGKGLPVIDPYNKDRMTATRRVAEDLGRDRMREATVHAYYRTWKRFGDPTKRHPALNFRDHHVLAVAGGGEGTQKARVSADALEERRAEIDAGKRATFSNPDAAIKAAHEGKKAGRNRDNITRLTSMRSLARAACKTNVWDYEDHQRAQDVIADIEELVAELKAKPWSPGAPKPAPPTAKTKSHCSQGHELTDENSIVKANDARLCKTCKVRGQRERRGSKRTNVTEDEARHIRNLLNEGKSQDAVARATGRSRRTIGRVAKLWDATSEERAS